MAITRIILWLGNTLVICAALFALTAVLGLGFQEPADAIIFGGIALVIGILGSIFIISTQNTPARETTADALVFLLLFWGLVPVVMALPFYASGASSSMVNAWYESVSAFTTTGASSHHPSDLSQSILIYRSLLQWFGGVVVATFAVVILAALNLSGTGVHRSMLFTLKKGELFGRLIGIGRLIAGVYALFAGICFAGMILTGTPPFEAMCLSLSGISTGGLTPRDGFLASYISPLSAVVLAFFCLLGATNVAILWDLVRARNLRFTFGVISNVEFRTMLFIAGFLFLVGLVYTGLLHGFTVAVEALMFVSSAGFDYHVIGLEMIPPTLLIAFALIGGSALSTAGGIKIIRLLLLFRHLTTDLNRLSHPSRVVPVLFRGQVLPDRAFLSIWMYFLGYTLVFAAGTLALGASGMSYESAIASSAAGLANMGPLLDATLTPLSYAQFSAPQQVIMGVAMLIGRVEVLAVLAVLSPSLWRQ